MRNNIAASIIASATSAIMLALSLPTAAMAAAPGKTKTAMLSEKAETLLPLCASCHGIDGISVEALYPNLAGQKQAYLSKQLNDFRAGNRNNEIMSPMAEPLDDAMIKELTVYFANQATGR